MNDSVKDQVLDVSGHFPLLHLADGYELQTYFLVVSLALCVCVLFLVRRTEARGLTRNLALDISMILMIFGMLGARLFHVAFEEPRYYLEEPMRVFQLWRGGFVWYGGALLGALASVLYVRHKKLPLGTWLDLFAPVAALGYALGRVACFLTGCCFGSVCVLGSGLRFRHPTQLYAILWELAALWLLLILERARGRVMPALKIPLSIWQPFNRWLKPSGRLFALWLVLHGLGRILMEAFRADPRGPEPLGFSIATWISMLLILSTLALTWSRHSTRQQ
jgi:phosphatidylglycerol:prolipoprotein diacylglycerol transferase